MHDKLRALPHASENFFLQQMLWGKARAREAFMGVVPEETFDTIRASRARVGFECSDLTAFLNAPGASYQFFSLSNITSYLTRSGELELLSSLERRSAPGAVAVVRSFLRVFEPPGNGTRWIDESASFAEPMRAERTQAYRIHVLRLGGSA
jgi:S-adenosylmethionine:diacylglycerol 3-amino-3-carboxypropyl transferase